MKKEGFSLKPGVRRTALYLAGAAVAFGIIAYMSYHLIDRFSDGLELIDAVPTTVTKTVHTYAYIMRDGTELATDMTTGSISPAVRNGDHVSAYSKLADIYSGASPDAENRIRELDLQAALLEKNMSEEHSVTYTEGMDSDIYDTVFDIRSYCERGDFTDAVSARMKLLTAIKKRAVLTGEITDYSMHISRIEAEINSERSKLGALISSIYSPSAGYYFSEADGYEEIFNSDKIDTMTFEEFEKMTEQKSEAGDFLYAGTIVHGYKWYIACITDKASAAKIKDMRNAEVVFSYGGEVLTMQVYRVIPENGGDRAVMVLSCGRIPQGFDFTRVQPVEITTEEYTGYRIPRSAIRIVGGFEGVYVKDEVTIGFRRINVIYEDGGSVICTEKPDYLKYETAPDGSFLKDEFGNRIEKIDLNDEAYPWIKRNDIIVVSGTDLFMGKVVKD